MAWKAARDIVHPTYRTAGRSVSGLLAPTPGVTIRLMRCRLFVLCVFCVSAAANEHEAARAWHRQEWVTWSNKTGLPVKTIERLWRTTMGPDDDPFSVDAIEMVDAASLRSRNQVLFVTAGGNGHCLSLYVFGNSGNVDKPLWELSGLPNDASGICHEQLLPYPAAYARPTGDIVVQVPTGAAWVKRKRLGDYPVSTALMVYTYRWSGSTYKLATTERIVTYDSKSFNPEKCTTDKPCP